jgi:hypothetical protein
MNPALFTDKVPAKLPPQLQEQRSIRKPQDCGSPPPNRAAQLAANAECMVACPLKRRHLAALPERNQPILYHNDLSLQGATLGSRSLTTDSFNAK